MLHKDGFRRVLDNLTYSLEKKDAKKKKKKKKNVAWVALYHNRSYPIEKDNPPLKLVIGEHQMEANVLQDDKKLKISFTMIPGFIALFLVAATKPGEEKWVYSVASRDNPATQVGYVCPGNGYVTINIQVQLISQGSRLEPNLLCPSFRLQLVFPLYQTQMIVPLFDDQQKNIVKKIEEFEIKPNWSSYLDYIGLKENKQLLWTSKSDFLESLFDQFNFFLLFEIANTGCHKYVFSNVLEGKALVKNIVEEGQFRLKNDVLFKDALEVVKKNLGCGGPLPILDNTAESENVMLMEKTLFVVGANVFQSYFILFVLKRSFMEYDNLLSDETKAVDCENPTERIEVTTERETEREEPDQTGTNEPDPAYDHYVARVLEFNVLHLLHVAIVDEVGSRYRAYGKKLSREQPSDEYKSAFNRNLSELHHEAQAEASLSFREDESDISDGYICQPWSIKRNKHHKKFVYSKQKTDEIGRRGEKYAYTYLKDKYPKEHFNVLWPNCGTEAYLHYDFVVYDREKNINLYFEAKTTSNPSKDWFLISPSQYHEAALYGHRYTILRIHLDLNEPDEDKCCEVTEYTNPTQHPELEMALIKVKRLPELQVA